MAAARANERKGYCVISQEHLSVFYTVIRPFSVRPYASVLFVFFPSCLHGSDLIQRKGVQAIKHVAGKHVHGNVEKTAHYELAHVLPLLQAGSAADADS